MYCSKVCFLKQLFEYIEKSVLQAMGCVSKTRFYQMFNYVFKNNAFKLYMLKSHFLGFLIVKKQ